MSWQDAYATDSGPMQLGGDGGSFLYQNGRSEYASIDDDTVQGSWRQDHSSQRCPDGGFWGRFRFTFTPTGFTGLWGYRNDDPSTGWSGARQ